jgi:hypothetical protein
MVVVVHLLCHRAAAAARFTTTAAASPAHRAAMVVEQRARMLQRVNQSAPTRGRLPRRPRCFRGRPARLAHALWQARLVRPVQLVRLVSPMRTLSRC